MNKKNGCIIYFKGDYGLKSNKTLERMTKIFKNQENPVTLYSLTNKKMKKQLLS